MRHNWEYKPFKQVATTITPNKKIDKSSYLDKGDYPIISQEEKYISGYWNIKEDLTRIPGPVVIFGDHSRVLKYVDFDFVVGADGVKIIQPKENLEAKFLYYSIKALNLPSLGYSRHFKLINESQFPIPNLSIQERIVQELDEINGMIEGRKEQLRLLDQLAQSIFYEMFGDPITNPKGWEVKILKNISELINGRAYKQDELLKEGKYKVIRVGNFFTNSEFYYSNLELEQDKYIQKGDLIFAWSASFGAFIWEGEKVIYHYHIWKVKHDPSQINKEYFRVLLNTMTSSFMKDVHGIGMVHLTKSGMENYIIPVPPIKLQNEFAAKIEMIEEQKKDLESSIKELETLLASRMDYWFN